MVPLTQNPLLKLPGSSSRLESLALLSPYQILVAIGVSFTVLTGAFIGTEQWLSISLAESIHQVGEVYSPPITAGLKAKSEIAQLLAENSESFLSGIHSPDDGQIQEIESQKQEVVPVLIKAAEGPNTPEERTSLSTNIKAFLNIESQLATIDARGSGQADSEATHFSDLMDGDIHSFLDTSDFLNVQRERDLINAENKSDVSNAKDAFYLVFYLGEALLVVSSFLMVLWFRRIVNPGVAAALVVMVCGGGLLQSHLGASVTSLQKMEQVFLSIRNLGKLQAHAAEADLYLHSWLISQKAEDWQKFYDKTYQIYNNSLGGTPYVLDWKQGSGLGSETESHAPFVTSKESSFPVNEVTTMGFGTQIGGSGLLEDEWNQFAAIEQGTTSRETYASLLNSYNNLLRELEQLRQNKIQGSHDDPLELLVNPSGINDSFKDFNQKIAVLQSKESMDFEVERLNADAKLQSTTFTCLMTALIQVVLFWFGLISRLREYMR